MSHGGSWRGTGYSRNRDSYRSWLHRVVRLSFHFLLFLSKISDGNGLLLCSHPKESALRLGDWRSMTDISEYQAQSIGHESR
jgi:hypothetical protein